MSDPSRRRRSTVLKYFYFRRGSNRSQPLLGTSSPYCDDVCGRHWRLTSFFPIVDTCLSCDDIARQICATVPRWRIFGDFLGPAFPASRMKHISDLHSKFAQGHIMCISMVDTQSATAKIRRGKKERTKERRNYNVGQCPTCSCPAEYRWRALFNAAKFG